MRKTTLWLLLCTALTLQAQSETDSLAALFTQSKGQQQIELANEIFRILDEEEVTDSLVQFTESTPADTIAANLWYWLGQEKFFAQDFKSSAPLLEKAATIITPADKVWVSDCHSDLAICYARTGFFTKALEKASLSAAMDEELGDKTRLCISYNNLASIYVMTKQPDEAEKYTLRSLQLATETNDSVKMAARYGTLAELQQTKGDYGRALDYATKAWRLDSLRNDRMRMAVRQVQKANALMRMGRIGESMALMNEARPVLQAAGNVISLAICMNQQGYAAQMQGRWQQAADYYGQALNIYNRTGDRNSKLKSLWGLWNTYGHLDADKALAYMQAYSQLQDSIYQEDVVRITADYNARYESDQLRMKSDELTRQNEEQRHRGQLMFVGGTAAIALLLVIIALLVYALRLKSRTARMQQQLREQRDRFFTNLTHELRTPLTVINAATDELLDNNDSRKQAQTIRRHSRTLLELTNQMLDIARMGNEEGKVRCSEPWVHADVTAFVAMMHESYAAYAEKRGIRLSYDSAPAVEMDFVEDYLRKILRNLISNAIKFSKPGSTVAITTRTDGDRLLIDVSDQGEGISEEQLPHIFEPFYQASSDNYIIGTGVGLPLAKLCAEAMQGTISVASTQGKGSTFTVVLPLRRTTGKTADEGLQAEDHRLQTTDHRLQAEDYRLQTTDHRLQTEDYRLQTTDYRLQTEEVGLEDEGLMADDGEAWQNTDAEDNGDENATRLLIVEDAPEVAHYVARLMPADYRVSFATNGSEAIEKARRMVPDIVVSDVMMPGIDGLELCRQIRADSLLCHIPVVMVTAKVTAEDRLAGLQAGADAYIEKPFSGRELLVQIQNLLQQRQLLQQQYRKGGDANSNTPSSPETDIAEVTPAACLTDDGKQPAESNLQSPSERDVEFLNKVERLLEKQLLNCNINLEQMASDLCITRLQLNRKMKALLGENMRDHVNRVRIERACRLLGEGNSNVSEVARACGIDDVAYFSRFFRKMTGMSPTEYLARRSSLLPPDA